MIHGLELYLRINIFTDEHIAESYVRINIQSIRVIVMNQSV